MAGGFSLGCAHASHGKRVSPGKGGVAAGWLPEALMELDGIDEEIEADELPQVPDSARSEARRTLRALSNQRIAPVVYPTEDAEVSVYFKAPGIPYAVQVLLESGGGATWSSIVPGYNANGRCEDSSQLPMGLLLESLQALSEIPGRG